MMPGPRVERRSLYAEAAATPTPGSASDAAPRSPRGRRRCAQHERPAQEGSAASGRVVGGGRTQAVGDHDPRCAHAPASSRAAAALGSAARADPREEGHRRGHEAAAHPRRRAAAPATGLQGSRGAAQARSDRTPRAGRCAAQGGSSGPCRHPPAATARRPRERAPRARTGETRKPREPCEPREPREPCGCLPARRIAGSKAPGPVPPAPPAGAR